MFCSVYLNLFAISAKSKILHRVLGMLLALTCIEKDFLGQIADSIFLVPCISGRDQIVVNIPKGHQSIFLKFSYVFYQIMYQHFEQTPFIHILCFLCVGFLSATENHNFDDTNKPLPSVFFRQNSNPRTFPKGH